MRKYRFTDKNGKTWERITKKQARAAYNNGLTVLFCPVNMRPFTPWHLEIDINKNFEGYNGVLYNRLGGYYTEKRFLFYTKKEIFYKLRHEYNCTVARGF